MRTKVFFRCITALALIGLVGCTTTGSKGGFAKKANSWDRTRGISDSDLPTPAWWYARRDYDRNYMHWGKMRHPDASTRSEKWILLNEDQCKAPHRNLARVSADNGREYRFYGFFMQDRGYEPASDELCPIFVLQKWEPLNAPAGKSAAPPVLAGSNEPPPQPEAEEPTAPPKPVPAQAVALPPSAPAAKPAATATNATTQVKRKPAAATTNTTSAAKPKPVAKKKTPAPAPVPAPVAPTPSETR